LNNLRFFQFKEKLTYKLYLRNKKFTSQDEYLTSKMCSNCMNIKWNLGSNKIYSCNSCGKIYDRDVNACKNIMMKTMY